MARPNARTAELTVWCNAGMAYHNMRKLIHQCQSLSRDLPVQWASSIFVAQDENNFSALKCARLYPAMLVAPCWC